MSYSVICENLSATEHLAVRFSDAVKDVGAFVSMFSDIGCGKTAFARFVCKHLGVKEKVNSPSFVIINEYKSGVLPIYHFDLYRLENEGISTIINELEEYSEGKILTFVEWAQFSQGNIPFDRIELRINYINENEREFVFNAFGEKSEKILKRLQDNENIMLWYLF